MSWKVALLLRLNCSVPISSHSFSPQSLPGKNFYLSNYHSNRELLELESGKAVPLIKKSEQTMLASQYIVA